MRFPPALYVLCFLGSYAFAEEGLTIRGNVVADSARRRAKTICDATCWHGRPWD